MAKRPLKRPPAVLDARDASMLSRLQRDPSQPIRPDLFVKYEFKAFDEKGFLSLYVFDTLKEAERTRAQLRGHYQKKLKHAVQVWRRLTKEGASNVQFAWSAAGGREKPTIEQWTNAMTPILRVTREVVS